MAGLSMAADGVEGPSAREASDEHPSQTLRMAGRCRLASEVNKYRKPIRRQYRDAYRDAGLSNTGASEFFTYDMSGNRFLPQAQARHPYKASDSDFKPRPQFLFNHASSINCILVKTIADISEKYWVLGPHLPSVMIAKEFRHWNENTFAIIPEASPSSRQAIDARVKLLNDFQWKDAGLRDMKGWRILFNGLVEVRKELEEVQRRWAFYVAQIGMQDHLKSLELGLVQVETNLIQFLNYILLPGDLVSGFDPRKVASDRLQSSLRGRVLLALLSDPDVKSAVGGNVDHANEKSLPRLDTDTGLAQFFRNIEVKASWVELCRGFMSAKDCKLTDSERQSAIKLWLKLNAVAAAIASASEMAKRAKDISSVGGDLLLAKSASKETLISSLNFTKACLTTMITSLESLRASVQRGHTEAKKKSSKSVIWNNTTEAIKFQQAIVLSDVDANISEILTKLESLNQEALEQEAKSKTHEYKCYLDSSYDKFDVLSAFKRVSIAAVPQADPVPEAGASFRASAYPSMVQGSEFSSSVSGLSRWSAQSVKDDHRCALCEKEPGLRRGVCRWRCRTCGKKVCKKCMGGTAWSRTRAKAFSSTGQIICSKCDQDMASCHPEPVHEEFPATKFEELLRLSLDEELVQRIVVLLHNSKGLNLAVYDYADISRVAQEVSPGNPLQRNTVERVLFQCKDAWP